MTREEIARLQVEALEQALRNGECTPAMRRRLTEDKGFDRLVDLARDSGFSNADHDLGAVLKIGDRYLR